MGCGCVCNLLFCTKRAHSGETHTIAEAYLNKAQGDGGKAVADCQDDGTSHCGVDLGRTINLFWCLLAREIEQLCV